VSVSGLAAPASCASLYSASCASVSGEAALVSEASGYERSEIPSPYMCIT